MSVGKPWAWGRVEAGGLFLSSDTPPTHTHMLYLWESDSPEPLLPNWKRDIKHSLVPSTRGQFGVPRGQGGVPGGWAGVQGLLRALGALCQEEGQGLDAASRTGWAQSSF